MIAVLIAVLAGLLLGSFGSVVVDRLPQKRSLWAPGSHCASCNAPIAPKDNIPLLSFLMLGGRCRACKEPIPRRIPVIEGLTGATFGLATALLSKPTDLIAYLPLFWVLIVLAFIDLEHMILPNVIVVPSIAIGAALLGVSAALGPGAQAWTRAMVGGVAAFVFFLVLALIAPKGMGMGDVKLAALLGLALGYFSIVRVFIGLFLSFIIGALAGVIVMVARNTGLKTQLPFGPSLALGTMVAILWGGDIGRILFP